MLLIALFALLAADPAEGAGWMSGCWAGEARGLRFEEQWMKPAGGLLLGVARTSKGPRVVFHEFMRIAAREGKLVFMPRIGSSEKPVLFTAIKQSDTEVVFENAAHDFPQRVIYRRTGEGELLGRIEGVDKGKERSEDYPMKRVACH